jgi:uncharacterized membrane protein YccC
MTSVADPIAETAAAAGVTRICRVAGHRLIGLTDAISLDEKRLRALAFVVRCSGAATAAYELASGLGLAQATWAAMSALIVSQERLHETRTFLTGRILGTVAGAAVTIAVSEITSRAAASIAVQLTLSVAICALLVREFPNLRVAMWTCPIILLPAQAATPIMLAAISRGGEVILGALVGFGFHLVAEQLVNTIIGARLRHPARRS